MGCPIKLNKLHVYDISMNFNIHHKARLFFICFAPTTYPFKLQTLKLCLSLERFSVWALDFVSCFPLALAGNQIPDYAHWVIKLFINKTGNIVMLVKPPWSLSR